ncbi:MAG: GNAT family N-acetyltransferase [Acidimicrobiia bacterium]|nr:GNAT family N-acetyltransferase [Acidimicrobiia bacterium]
MNETPYLQVAQDDPLAADVDALLGAHLALAHEVTPPGHVHALDGAGLQSDDIRFYSARDEDGSLLGIGALRDLGVGHYEIKSMHTASEHRGRGVGRAILEHLVEVARRSGGNRVSLETGTMDAFASARAMYAGYGFVVCEPFGDYEPVPNSVCMTFILSEVSNLP